MRNRYSCYQWEIRISWKLGRIFYCTRTLRSCKGTYPTWSFDSMTIAYYYPIWLLAELGSHGFFNVIASPCLGARSRYDSTWLLDLVKNLSLVFLGFQNVSNLPTALQKIETTRNIHSVSTSQMILVCSSVFLTELVATIIKTKRL